MTEAGTGTGTVTTTSLTCPGTCSVAYNFGTMLTLTATPTGGSTFTGWSGTGSGTCNGTTGSCAVTMDQARAITATFAAGPQTLTVTTAGTGTGVVTSSPTGISCGATCSMTQPFNTVVTLTATPSGNDTFSGWSGAGSGACNGTATATCVVTMNAAKSVTATFAAGPRAITIVPAGLGTGTVTSSPAGLTCGATCTASFAYNTSVTLTADRDRWRLVHELERHRLGRVCGHRDADLRRDRQPGPHDHRDLRARSADVDRQLPGHRQRHDRLEPGRPVVQRRAVLGDLRLRPGRHVDRVAVGGLDLRRLERRRLQRHLHMYGHGDLGDDSDGDVHAHLRQRCLRRQRNLRQLSERLRPMPLR